MKLRSSMVALVAFAALGGCGSGGSDEDKVRDAYREFGEAFADGDGDKVCDLLTTAARKELLGAAMLLGGGTDCPGIASKLKTLLDKGDIETIRRASIRKLTITGDTAVVEATKSIDGDDDPTLMRKVSGDWLVDADPDDDDSDSGSGSAPDPTTTTSEPEAALPAAVAVGDRLRQDDYTVTVTGARKTGTLPGDDFTDPVKADGLFVILDLRVRNQRKELATFDNSLVELVDEDGTVYSSSTGGAARQIGGLPDYIDERAIQPKTSESGALAFDVPRSANVVKAQFASSLEDLFSADFTGAVELDL